MCNCGGCDTCVPLQDEMNKLEIPKREDLKKEKYYLTDDDLLLLEIFPSEYMVDD